MASKKKAAKPSLKQQLRSVGAEVKVATKTHATAEKATARAKAKLEKANAKLAKLQTKAGLTPSKSSAA